MAKMAQVRRPAFIGLTMLSRKKLDQTAPSAQGVPRLLFIE
jgi:hypothetical protein